jgi:hypothetical protein
MFADALMAMKKNWRAGSIASLPGETSRRGNEQALVAFCHAWALISQHKKSPKQSAMKKTRFFILASLAAATLGLSSCVVDEGYGGGYAYVERPYYRDYNYHPNYYPRHRYHQRHYDHYDSGYYHRGPVRSLRGEIHAARADLHHALFH